MSTTEQHLKRIQDKLQLLLREHSALEKENLKLRGELELANLKLATQLKGTEELKQQVSVLKMNAGEMSEADKKEFERKINTYIKEIDRCIALLGE